MAQEIKGYKVLIERARHDAADGIHVYATALELHAEEGQVEYEEHVLKAGTFRLVWRAEGAQLLREEGNFGIFERHNPEARVWVELHLVKEERAKDRRESKEPVAQSKHLHIGEGSSEREHHAAAPPTRVQLMRTAQGGTRDLILWAAIQHSTESISFPHYSRFLDQVLFGADNDHDHGHGENNDATRNAYREMRESLRERTRGGRSLTGSDAYQALRDATDWFLKVHVGVLPSPAAFERINADLTTRVGSGLSGHSIQEAWDAYTVRVDGVRLLPYLNIIRDKLTDGEPLGAAPDRDSAIVQASGLLRDKLQFPCFIELIWSYWQEEGMLVQTINAVAERFQNRRVGKGRDPLATLEIDPLRPLNNLLWGYVQAELSRLSVRRRAHEYAHYGLRLEGKAVAGLRPADTRSRFIEAFHNFLQGCCTFFEKDDQTTVIADAFPVLNAIKEVHYVLAASAHNQFGDLPSTARAEMLIQQWLLGRPEMREFLGGRVMVPYPERWMDRVDAMKSLQGWSDTSVVHFNDLAKFGERILLGARFGAWSTEQEPMAVANFCRHFRSAIQGYIHAYRAVTGVDLAAPVRNQQAAAERMLPPSVHLLRRFAAGRRV